jgi:hypothetical protein
MNKLNDLIEALAHFEFVFKLIDGSTWGHESLDWVKITLATLATVAKTIDDEVKKLTDESNGQPSE